MDVPFSLRAVLGGGRKHLSPLRQTFRDAVELGADQIEQTVGGDSGETPVVHLAPGPVPLVPSPNTLDHCTCALREGVALVPGFARQPTAARRLGAATASP